MSILVDAFSYLANVFSGRIRHWTTAHNVTLSQQWAKVEKLSPPFDGIFKQFLVAAGIVVESFFGPNRKSEKILKVDLRMISSRQFEELYSLLLAYFCFMLYTVNPFLKEQLRETLLKIVSSPETASKLLRSLEGVQKFDMGALAGVAWESVVSVIGFGDKDAAGQLASFGIIAGHAYVDAARRIKAELNVPVSVQ